MTQWTLRGGSEIIGIWFILREKNLIVLIEDGEKMNFNPSLLQDYKKQLSEVQAVLKVERDKKARIRKEDFIKKSYDNGKIKLLGDGCFSVPSSFFVKGITPTMVNNVLKGGLNKNDD